MDDFPALSSPTGLAAYVASHPAKARACWALLPDGQCAIEYPFLGPPPPHQPRVCGFRDDRGQVCGIGGHNARTHNNTASLATKALAHAIWILRNMHNLGIHHVTRHVRVLLDILCGLEGRRVAYQMDATAEIQSILVMYEAVLQWWFRFRQSKQPKGGPCSTKRSQRSSIAIVNNLLVRFSDAPPSMDTDSLLADVPCPKLVVFLFPTSTTTNNNTAALRQLCLDAFTTQDVTILRRMANGHLRSCGSPNKNGCTCRCDDDCCIKVPRLNVDVVCCRRCGLPGHNKASCRERSTATHVAVALATLLDPHKAPRISAKTAHLTLFHCYDVIVTLLYRWSMINDNDNMPWHISGHGRLKRIDSLHPEILLRLYNHALASLKQCSKVGPTMLVVHRENCLMVEAAHAYGDNDIEDDDQEMVKRETTTIQQTVQSLIEATQDDDLERPRWFGGDRESAVSEMVMSSTQQDPRIAEDLVRFAFDDVVF